MLGNQYFMARNYTLAEAEFLNAFDQTPESIELKKKLIICFTQTDKLNQAVDYALELAENHFTFLVSTKPEQDDCPCKELVEKMKLTCTESPDDNVRLGILWLLCEPANASNYFVKSLKKIKIID